MKRNMEWKQGLVSVIIPTYKRSDMLGRAIESVLGQTYDQIEALVVDDNIPGSPESQDVYRIVSGYQESGKVFYVGQKEHINGAVARNAGIAQSQAEYIAFLDDDEEWHPEKVEKQVAYLAANPQVAGVSCLYSNYRGGRVVASIQPYDGEQLQLKILTGQVTVHASTFLCRHDTLNQSGAFHPALLRHQDLQMFVDFLNYGSIHPICEDLVKNHIDSEMNRPNVERLIQVKQAYFQAIGETVRGYGKKEKRRIRNAHLFEIIFIALKQRKWGVALKYLLMLRPDVASIRDLKIRWHFRGTVKAK